MLYLTLFKCPVRDVFSASFLCLFFSTGIFLAKRSHSVHLVKRERCVGHDRKQSV